MKISVKNLNGEKVKDLTLNDSVWNIETNDDCLKKSIKLQQAATRQGTAKVKTRSEVSGGGRKPWKQKGTGRARAGSSRSPLWRGGGIVFGPTPRNYTFKINKKERTIALKTALTELAKEKALVVVDKIELASLKTTEAKNLIKSLNIAGNILFVTNGDNENLFMACRNLGYAQVLMVDEINVLDLVYADYVVIEEEAVKTLEEGLK
jgi:large subunit ribosomal protein L4